MRDLANELADEIVRTAFVHVNRETGERRVVGFERLRLVDAIQAWLERHKA